MRFFVDHNLGSSLAKGLNGFGEDVVHLTEYFKPSTEDEEWLERIGKEGWFLITRDHAIRRKPREMAALRTHRVGAFFLGGKGLSRCQLIQQTVRNWPRLKELASKTNPPFAFRVPPKGTKIERITI